MITGELRSHIDRIWNTFWSGGFGIRLKQSYLPDTTTRTLMAFSEARAT